jgi:Lrp/AsnC family transcriptional regulator, regulator for asnA, asnC and gidA
VAQPTLRARNGEIRAPSAEISDLDKRIIEHLQDDGRRPFTRIAADLGVSEAAVRARTNRLIERGILQIVGVTDPLKLGFQQQAMIGVVCQADRLLEVAESIRGFPEVDYLVITAGSYDLLVEVVCEDNDDLLRFLTDKLRRVEGVRSTETFVYLRNLKQTYAWGTR